MEFRPLDVIVLEAEKKVSLLAQVIRLRTATFETHVVTMRDNKAEVWDAQAKGLIYNHLDFYAGREAWHLRYNHPLEESVVWNKAEEIKQKAKGYDFLALAGFLFGVKPFNDEERWYCAEHPFWSFQYTGHLLAPEDREPAFVYPSYFSQHLHFTALRKGKIGTDLKY